MAKYSTGSGGGDDDGDACELCGTESASLRKANVAGAELLVCGDCEPMGSNRNKDRKKREQQGGSRGAPENRKKRAAQNTAKLMDSSRGSDTDWVEGAEYDEDSLPYLVSGYGSVVTQARQDAGLTTEEVADELEIDEADLLAVEEGRATRADVAGSVIAKLEDRFGIELAE